VGHFEVHAYARIVHITIRGRIRGMTLPMGRGYARMRSCGLQRKCAGIEGHIKAGGAERAARAGFINGLLICEHNDRTIDRIRNSRHIQL
jgi:hypothetical protein